MSKLTFNSIQESIEKENDDFFCYKKPKKVKPKVRKMKNKD